MKNSWRLLLALLASFALVAAACGSDDAETDAGADSTEETSEETSDDDAMEESDDEAMEDDEAMADDDAMEDDAMEEEAHSFNMGLTFDIGGRGDQSFNDSAAAGADRAIADLGVTVTDAEPNADGSDRAQLLQLQADNSDLVVAVGFLFAGDVVAVAAENPDTNFAVIDDAMLDFDAEGGPAPLGDNIAGATFAEEQGSYLVGAAAALKSETGTLGFIGGVGGFGLIEKFEAGFTAGAQSINPDIVVIPQYITQAPDFDGFFAGDRAREIALSMYDQGADVIYHAAGGSGAGLFEAAKEQSESTGSQVWAIGVDSDQYNTAGAEVQPYILTSMLKRVDNAVYEITTLQANGAFTSGNVVYDLSTDGVGYSVSGGYIDDIVDQLEEIKASIVAGDIVVPTAP